MIRGRFAVAAVLSLLIAWVPASCAKRTSPPITAPAAPAAAAAEPAPAPAPPAESVIPERLSDQEFWNLVTDFSEPNGYFRSDNLLSNEIWLQYVIPELLSVTRPGRVYMGVGPGAELHLHRRSAAVDGLHRRRSARQPRSAPDVQGAVRAVGGPGRFRVAAVRAQAAGRTDGELERAGDLRRVLERGNERSALHGEPQDDPRRPARRNTASRSRPTIRRASSTSIATFSSYGPASPTG